MSDDDNKTDEEMSKKRPIQFVVWKRQRHITQVNAKREVDKIKMLLEVSDVLDEKMVSVSVEKIKGYKQRLRELDDKTLPLFEVDELENAVDESDEVEKLLDDYIYTAETTLKHEEHVRLSGWSTHEEPSAKEISQKQRVAEVENVKLPKLDIHRFNGDTLKWREFWDSFESAVHSKTTMPSIEKFQYLKSFLEGTALKIVEGYVLSSATYELAVAALKERFDHPERCINAHLDAMIYLAESGKSVAELQSTLDKCEAHLRNLAALGMAEETFGRVLAPLMLSKFPQFIRIEMNRKNCGEAWILANLRRYLKEEINARHMGSQTIGGHQGSSVVSKTTSNIAKRKNYNGRKYRTDSTLVTTNIRNKFAASENRSAVKMFPCAFCNGKDHFNENCKKFATSEDRWSAIHKDRCVICLRSNHNKNVGQRVHANTVVWRGLTIQVCAKRNTVVHEEQTQVLELSMDSTSMQENSRLQDCNLPQM